MRAIALFSGGKDSTYAIYLAMQQGYQVERLVTIFPEREDSYMYHVPVIERTRMLAEAMEIPQDVYSIGDSVEELNSILAKYNVDAVISGAIASNYQRVRIEEVCTDLGLLSYTPLWGKNQERLLKDMLLSGMKIMIVAVAAYGLGEDFLGKIIDEDVLEKLREVERKYSINIAGEGGEYESFVLDAPFFKRRVEILEISKRWNGMRGEIDILKARLSQKVF